MMRLAKLPLLTVFAWAMISQELRAQAIRTTADAPMALELENRPVVEPHLAIHPGNPHHLLAAAMITNAAESFEERASKQTCAAFLSIDGGETWRRQDFSITWCFDPWVVITRDGHAVFTALGRDSALPQQTSSALIVYHSADGGRTWDRPPLSLGTGHDHQTVATDLSSEDRLGWLYVVSSRDAREDNGKVRSSVHVSRSRNGGRTFDPPLHFRPNNLYIRAEMPVVASDGTLTIAFVEAAREDGRTLLVRRRAFVVRSTDGGYSFSKPLFVGEACGPPPTFSFSALAIDASSGPFRNRLYFACTLAENRGVALNYSADGGESWSEPQRIARTGPDSTVERKLMAMTVNNVGILGVVSVGGRPDPMDCYDVYFSASVDGGITFLSEQRISRETSCSNPAINGRSWSEGGDYFGIVADDRGSFRLVWSDARQGIYHLRTATVHVSR